MSDTLTVGTELPTLTVEPISRATLALFAGASGDHMPLHIDSDAARAAGFDDVFAHGMLSMAYLGRLLTNWVPQERIREWRVRFAAITPVHGQPHCSGRVTAINNGTATVELVVALDIGGTPANGGVAGGGGTITLTGDAVVDIT